MKIKIINLNYTNEDKINDFIRYIKVIDIKYQVNKYTNSIIIMYEE